MTMDEENRGVFFGQREEEEGVEGPFVCSDPLYGGPETGLEKWAVNQHCGLNDSESEDVLHSIVDPNEVYSSNQARESPSESDSGISEDPRSDSPPHNGANQSEVPYAIATTPTLYQVVYDINGLDGVKTEPGSSSVDVISIELDEWSSRMLVPQGCIVSELPSIPVCAAGRTSPLTAKDPCSLGSLPLYPDLMLTEEEQRLLNQEGIALPNNLPLTKAEERILKKVRRKIRNKQSAQDSRRRKKDYIDGLESRVSACSVQNQELQKTVQQLEKHNMSLVAQLRRLQSLIKLTSTKAAQTGTCILIFIFSLALIIFPSYSPFSSEPAVSEEVYRPAGVISRNILTDTESFRMSDTEDDVITDNKIPSLQELPPSNSDTDQSENADLSSITFQKPISSEEEANNEKEEVLIQANVLEEVKLKNVSLPSELVDPVDPESQPALPVKGQDGRSLDSAKPVHADEM
ncbi:cyclic AMP-responsive element-binding protein 3-like protein 4 isoform X2 [Polyodon spathula]|uniref:cyclic AMP-responsive element-binding protein 3-like protein 4 isoform X2 n=1 Tax=Polyodon spathula TaxID=7913 RepID=UPI001B7DE9CA|nr:cyclic AMP-responsive element-binding protein 3-like protein 4 isoform X2 [Polyodon spathula]